jgi:hypothetical protein
VARNFTEADYAALVANINELSTTKAGTAIATGSANGLMPAADKAALNAATNAATASTLVKRDSSGRLKAAVPTASDDVAVRENILIPPFILTTGTGSAYVATFTPAIPSLVYGMRLTVQLHVASLANPTINVNGLGAKAIIRSNMSAPPAGFLRQYSVHTLVYNGESFQLSGEGGEYGTAVASDVLEGKTIGTDEGVVTGAIPIRTNWNEAMAIDSTAVPNRLFLMPPKGFYDGYEGNSWVYRDDPNFIASNIRAGANIFGLTGTLVERKAAGGTQSLPVGSYISANVSGLSFRPRIIVLWRRSPNGSDTAREQAFYIEGGDFNNSILSYFPWTEQKWYHYTTANWSVTSNGFTFSSAIYHSGPASTVYWEAYE